MQLSKTYEYTFKVPVSYVNLPKQYYKGFLPNDTILVKMKLSGFKVIRYEISKPVLKLDVQKTELLQGKAWKVTDHLSKIREIFDEISRIVSVEPGQLKLQIKAVHKKQVPVKPLVSYEFKQGFKNKKEAELEPDSVWVYGQSAVLDTIKEVKTKTYNFIKVDKDIDFQVELVQLNEVKYNTNSVRYRMPVSEIIEDTMTLPVEISGKPAKINIFLFPKKINLKYKVYKEAYKNLKSGDFLIEVAYNPALKSWKPKLVKHPIEVFDYSIKPEKISFLIKQ